jgi:uncharacterized protein YprB with RNaseH-like and TPR domain
MSDQQDLHRRLERINRLRKLGVRRGVRDLPAVPVATNVSPAATPAAQAVQRPVSSFELLASSLLPGEEVHTPFGPAWVRSACYPLAERPDLAEWLTVQPAALAALDRNNDLLRLEPTKVAFIDTETTGLSLGAGTYTFLIGVGMFEGDAFLVRQFFMRNPAEERAQLHLVDETLGCCTSIVSFNGRGFDMPLINNRFVLAAMPLPLINAPHLDLLPPARRLWKARWGSCSLGNLERNVLGFQRTAEDVPGYLIPDIYRQYYLTGVATEMLAHVFYHNLEDIASMVVLGARMARFFRPESSPEIPAELHPLEVWSLGRCYDALDWVEAGIAAYRAALRQSAGGPEMAQILRELGRLYKRLERRDEAAGVWEDWISSVAGDDLTPYVELAKHHEWHTLDLPAARGWAAWALRIAEGWPPGSARAEALADLRHRLERVERKLAGGAADDDPEIEVENGAAQTD